MRKLSPSNSELFYGGVFHREELEEIEEALHTVADKITITTNDCEYDSVDELCKINPENFKSLDFATVHDNEAPEYYNNPRKTPPRIRVDISGRQAYLHAANSELLTLGVIGKIKPILQQTPRHWIERVRYNQVNLVAVLCSFAMQIGSLYSSQFKRWVSPFTGLPITIVSVSVILSVFARFGPQKYILLTKRSETRFWTKDNKDKVWIALIAGGVMFLLGLLGNSAIKFFIPNHK